MTDPELAAVFRPPFEAGVPDPGRVVVSRLRDAPALGACAAALGRVDALRAGSA